MRCEVLLFAQLADLLGASRVEVELPEGSTVADAAERVLSASPEAAALRDRVALAVDERRRMFRHFTWEEPQLFKTNPFVKDEKAEPQDIRQIWFAGFQSPRSSVQSRVEPLIWPALSIASNWFSATGPAV